MRAVGGWGKECLWHVHCTCHFQAGCCLHTCFIRSNEGVSPLVERGVGVSWTRPAPAIRSCSLRVESFPFTSESRTQSELLRA